MRAQDAQDILRIIESIWQYDMGPMVRDTWRPLFEEYEDAELVTQAIFDLAKTQQYRPTFALIREAIQKRQEDAYVPEVKEIDFVRSPMPYWVCRWYYARFMVTPPDMRIFPEMMSGLEPDEKGHEVMPEDAYVEEAKTVAPESVLGALTGGTK